MSENKENKKLNLEELEEVIGGKCPINKKVDKSKPGWYYRVSAVVFGESMFVEHGPVATKEEAETQALAFSALFQIAGGTPEITYEEVKAN